MKVEQDIMERETMHVGDVIVDETKRQVVWKVMFEEAQKDELAWNMLQNNRIEGILSFDYYCVDEFVCFQYPYKTLQPVAHYLQQKKAGFTMLFDVCQGLLCTLERGYEYLLNPKGYYLSADAIFWDRAKGIIKICYLPGQIGDMEKMFTTFVEYLMENTDHKDHRAVTFIYGLYDTQTTEGFVLENLRQYVNTFEERGTEAEQPIQDRQKNGVKTDYSEETQGFSLTYISDKKWKKKCSWIKKFLIGIGWKVESLADILIKTFDIGVYQSEKSEITVGSDEECELCIKMDTMERRHAIVGIEENQLYIIDLDSKEGTRINGQKISANVKTLCNANDIITFADISYRICRMKSG